MNMSEAPRPTWKQLLARERPLLLPFAHDALSARLIERAGFAAYGIGGFAKNGARTVQGYEAMGVAAIFMEDQTAPKRCGHMTGKSVIAPAAMAAKIRAAAAARRNPDTFIIARTDARAVHGLDDALRRGELYLRSGADGLFIEAPQSVEELARIGRAFAGVPQLANMVEGGGHTPILPPAELVRLGVAMVAYPTTLIFGVARTIEQALADLKAGAPANKGAGVDFDTFKDILGLAHWADIEQRAGDAAPALKARAART